MQGFNKYYPPDFDPRETHTLNDYRGIHALGKRAKDVDKGILVVRFELPFNIWCLSCPTSAASSTHATSSTSGRLSGHLGAGVRYNAQKIKVGNYHSTPIWGFRCKCHLCGSWFEIRTDPKNAQYIVHSGAKKQESDWDPEENGGFAVRDTEAPSASEPPTDAFLALEKAATQSTAARTQTKAERFEELVEYSSRATADPYALSQSLRRSFREEKKKEAVRMGADEEIRARIGLRDGVGLLRSTVEQDEEGRNQFLRAKERIGKERQRSAQPMVKGRLGLERTIKANTARRLVGDAFGPVDLRLGEDQLRRATRGHAKVSRSNGIVAVAGLQAITGEMAIGAVEQPSARGEARTLIGAIAGYGSDDD